MTVTTAKPPSFLLTLTEGARATYEIGTFFAFRSAMKALPKGDGHPVIVLPGFVASDRSTKPMRNLLTELGYDTHAWGLGRNLRFNAEREKEMLDLLCSVYERSGRRKVSLIGWSLGGVFAREIAKRHPDKVRIVISLGSPISADRGHSSARHLFEAINGNEGSPERDERYARVGEAPPVPTTSILTKYDGIVAWQGSIQKPHGRLDTENIMVPASHVGLGVNPVVMVAIADRLAQKEGAWVPFERKGWRSLFFKGVTTR